MKTLKILTAVLIIALATVFATGMLDFREEENLYANDPSKEKITSSNYEEKSPEDKITSNTNDELRSDSKNGY